MLFYPEKDVILLAGRITVRDGKMKESFIKGLETYEYVMKYYKYIWLIVIMTGMSVNSGAQYLNIVCPGDTGHIYRVSGSEGSSFVWTVNGGTIVQNYNDSVKVNWGNTAGEFEVRVQEFSKFGCPSLPVSGMVLVSAPSLDLGDDIELCQGETSVIVPTGNYVSYLWHDGSTAPTYLASNQGLISLEVSDEYGCKRSDDLFVTVHPLPRVNLGRDTTLCGIESLILDGGSDGASFNWSTGDVTREITVFSGQQTIWLRIKDVFNCENADTIIIRACSSTDYFKDIPTAFTPNADGRNDEWRIPQLEAFPYAVMEIFDRWGNLVFRSDPGYSSPWDGTSKGREMPMDSYYFVIKLNSGDMEPVVGTVTIIR